MQRYFINVDQIRDTQATLTGEDAHHIGHVMRMKPLDQLEISDGAGNTYLCRIEAIEVDQVTCLIEHRLEESTDLPVNVTLVQGLPKGDKLDLIVQKSTELGVTAVYPFASERAIVKWESGQKVQKKLDRLSKIAKEAAEQSHRSSLPILHSPIGLKHLLELGKSYTHKMVCFEEEAKRGERRGFASLLDTIKPSESLLVVVGPEGGLSSQEVDSLIQNGFHSVGLGPRILRTETASLYVLAAVSYHFELAMR